MFIMVSKRKLKVRLLVSDTLKKKKSRHPLPQAALAEEKGPSVEIII